MILISHLIFVPNSGCRIFPIILTIISVRISMFRTRSVKNLKWNSVTVLTKLVLIKVEIASTEYFVDQIVDQQNIWLTKEV